MWILCQTVHRETYLLECEWEPLRASNRGMHGNLGGKLDLLALK